MKLYLDAEWNDYQGALLSLALVSEAGNEFYVALEFNGVLSPWVVKNVHPNLGPVRVNIEHARSLLCVFLMRFDKVEVIADWPEDIAHFCNLLVTGPGTRIDMPELSFSFRPDLDSDDSLLPHNALCDARAIRDKAMKAIKRQLQEAKK